MDKKKVLELLDKYHNGTITPEEKGLLDGLYNEVLKSRLASATAPNYNALKSALDKKTLHTGHKSLIKRLVPYTVAASILIAAALVIYLNQRKSMVNHPPEIVNQDVPPGYNQATLSLSDGTTIGLDSAKVGIQVSDDAIVYNDHTPLSVVSTNKHSPEEGARNLVLTTPKGGQYQVILPDGTKVWLNAASALKYPSRFIGNKREVFLEGEAYFEIKDDKTKPFRVLSKNQAILVLGTSFNVNTYEPTAKTTLVSGAIQVAVDGREKSARNDTGGSLLLKPGEQSVLNGTSLTKQQADIESATAWKNGYFRFKGESIQNIMQQLSRWYNIDFEYSGTISGEGYNGKISRFKNISQVLAVLTETGSVHFKIEGRRVTVMP